MTEEQKASVCAGRSRIMKISRRCSDEGIAFTVPESQLYAYPTVHLLRFDSHDLLIEIGLAECLAFLAAKKAKILPLSLINQSLCYIAHKQTASKYPRPQKQHAWFWSISRRHTYSILADLHTSATSSARQLHRTPYIYHSNDCDWSFCLINRYYTIKQSNVTIRQRSVDSREKTAYSRHSYLRKKTYPTKRERWLLG